MWVIPALFHRRAKTGDEVHQREAPEIELVKYVVAEIVFFWALRATGDFFVQQECSYEEEISRYVRGASGVGGYHRD
jgi:hypothetical protein